MPGAAAMSKIMVTQFSKGMRLARRNKARHAVAAAIGAIAGSAVANGDTDVEGTVLAAEMGTAAPIGRPVIELLALAYRANVPAMLVGAHGLGKSEITGAAAIALGIDIISRDLSLMEPPDLVGLPRLDGGATTFMPPDFLPRETGRGGFLLIEEINRAFDLMHAGTSIRSVVTF